MPGSTASTTITRAKSPDRGGPADWVCLHFSSGHLGGGERSLLEILDEQSGKPPCLLPEDGPLADALTARGHAVHFLPFPRFLRSLSQRSGGGAAWAKAILLFPEILIYGARLSRRLTPVPSGRLLSHGVKSHALLLALAPWLCFRGWRPIFDIRDFIRPLALRRALSRFGRPLGAGFLANSAAVAADFPGAEVRYPRIHLPRPTASRRKAAADSGRRILLHAAYWAPYKGQVEFLELASALQARGFDGEYWVAGVSAYPAPEYEAYAARVRRAADAPALRGRVKLWGDTPWSAASGDGAPEDLQALMESADLLVHCTTEPEPFGRVLVEAALCGCRVLGRRGSGACEVLEEDSGVPDWVRAVLEGLGPDFLPLKLPQAGYPAQEATVDVGKLKA